MFRVHKDGKWCATSHTHVAVVQCCHMPARDCLTLNYKLVLVAGMWVGNLAWCWNAHSGQTSFVKEGNDHSLLLLQWSHKHSTDYTQQSLNNHYYQYTTNRKFMSDDYIERTYRQLYYLQLTKTYTIQMAYYSNTYTAFNAINSWTKDAAEASIKITDHPSAYLKMAQN